MSTKKWSAQRKCLGYAGHSQQSFVTSLCGAALKQGWRPVALNYRYACTWPLPTLPLTCIPHRPRQLFSPALCMQLSGPVGAAEMVLKGSWRWRL